MPERPVIHYTNLSRGCFCPHDTLHNTHIIRIQSTWCEQKRWDDILTHLGADLYFCLAMGYTCVVHDQSEKNRETRACWQGLPWIRFATQMAWFGMAEPVLLRGNKHNVTGYFGDMYYALDERTITMLKYFRQFADINQQGELISCYGKEF